MSAGLEYDEAASQRLEATYTTSDVVAQRGEVLRLLDLRPGEHVLDVGVGPGFLARAMAEIVGSTGLVHGVDVSESMLALARKWCANSPSTTRITIERADATTLPFADNSFDAAVVSQVYEYVSDVPAALRELFRVLRPGGRVVVVDTDWDSLVWNAEDPMLSTNILSAWEQHATDSHLPRSLTPRLMDAGFQILQREVFVLFNPEFESDTYSFGISRLIGDFVVGRQGLTQDDVDRWLEGFDHLHALNTYFFSLNRYLFLARK